MCSVITYFAPTTSKGATRHEEGAPSLCRLPPQHHQKRTKCRKSLEQATVWLQYKASFSLVRLNISHTVHTHTARQTHTLLSPLCPTALPSWLEALNPQLYFSITSSISMEHFTVQLLCQRSLPATTATTAVAFSPPTTPMYNVFDLVRGEIVHNPADLSRPQGSISVGPDYICTVSRGSLDT